MTRKEKQSVHRVVMTEEKRSIVHQLLEEYGIQTAESIQETLRDLLENTLKEMMEAEMDEHLGYGRSERPNSGDYRSGYKPRRINGSSGGMDIQVPQDRKSTFEPQVVRKRQESISGTDRKIISMYTKGMTTCQISDTLVGIYGFEASEEFILGVTGEILPQVGDWQSRPLEEVYPAVYIDTIYYSAREDGIIRKLTTYVILGLTLKGKKEVLSIRIGEDESPKYWLCVLNELKNRDVRDIFVLCSDRFTGIKEAITATFPKTEQQRCIVHVVQNTLRYISDKDRKAFATNLKITHHAADEGKALEVLEKVAEKQAPKYPNSMERWHGNWDVVFPIFKFSMEVKKVIYATNTIESLNSTYRKLNSQRSVFPGSTSLLKTLYLATFEATKK